MVVVEIPPGCPEGKIIPLKKDTTGETIDYVISSQKHTVYTRVKEDLHMDKTLTLAEYIDGFSLTITTLDQKKKKIGYLVNNKIHQK